MKTKLFTALFLLFLCNIAFSQERKVRVYFSAKVSKPCYQKTNLEICETVFDNDFQVFMPQNIFIPELEFDMVEKCAYEADKAAIDWSDIVFYFLHMVRIVLGKLVMQGGEVSLFLHI